jgi:hypothetical protein
LIQLPANAEGLTPTVLHMAQQLIERPDRGDVLIDVNTTKLRQNSEPQGMPEAAVAHQGLKRQVWKLLSDKRFRPDRKIPGGVQLSPRPQGLVRLLSLPSNKVQRPRPGRGCSDGPIAAVR